MAEFDQMEMILGLRLGRVIAGARCLRTGPNDITAAVFENGVLYIVNASATQSDNVLEVN